MPYKEVLKRIREEMGDKDFNEFKVERCLVRFCGSGDGKIMSRQLFIDKFKEIVDHIAKNISSFMMKRLLGRLQLDGK